jgi:uncharacterized protein
VKNIIVFVLKLYKKIVSPVFESVFGKACRFTPTCSEYTIIALERFGVVKGIGLGVKRFARCQPWGESGYDPLPD